MKKLFSITACVSLCVLSTACSLPLHKQGADVARSSSSEAMSNEKATDIAVFYGRWVERNPINHQEYQGFMLNQDLSAKSINMETLQYQSWNYQDGYLSMTVLSIGNKLSGTDTMIYKVISVDATTLVLDDQGQRLIYTRQK